MIHDTGSGGESRDQNDNSVKLESNSQNNIFTEVFHSFNSSQRKRVFPRYVKHFLSQFRRSKDCFSNQSSEDRTVTPQNRSTVVRHASLHSTPPSDENSPKDLKISSSNVHKKVLHFENCANSNSIPDAGDRVPPTNPTPPTSSCVEKCPGGTFYPPTPTSSPTKHKEDPALKPSTQEPPGRPQVLTGRNLKRVPSERFQKMRRKVQKLMLPAVKPVDTDEVFFRCENQDETSFLQSLRIPTPSQVRQDYERQPCMMLRLPDHILSQVFSHLDTRSLAAMKCCCTDFKFIINTFDIRGCDSRWMTDERYIDDPCKQCRRQFVRGDTTVCCYHPKRYYSDIPYGRSYWMCCFKCNKNAPGCKIGLHDNDWRTVSN
ncbi:uncharacterized protein LOC100177012 [Ciona intestinalis]